MAALRAVADEEALWGWEGRGEGYEAALAAALHYCCCESSLDSDFCLLLVCLVFIVLKVGGKKSAGAINLPWSCFRGLEIKLP